LKPAGFLKLVIEALEAARVEYLIGGAIAEWAWGEPRATQDLDLVVKTPIKSINKLSKELGKRDMLIPAEIILDSILEDRADIPINAIHMHSGLKVDLYPVREGDELRQSAFQRREQLDSGPLLERYLSTYQRNLFCTNSCTLGLASNRNTPEISRPFSSQRK
jgi:hypothetical protein